MSLLYNQQLLSKLKDLNYLLLDNNVIIAASKYPDLLKLLETIRSNGCPLLTIYPVLFEFLRGGDSLETFNKRLSFFNGLLQIWPLEKQFHSMEEAIIVFQRFCPKVEYADFLLGICLYKLPRAYLLTGDISAFPLNVFNREDIITLEDGDTIRNYGLYSLSQEKFQKAALNILKQG